MTPIVIYLLLSAAVVTGQMTPTSDVSSNRVRATGSTTSRSMRDRFAEVVNVKDFGATGNGTTDDTAAIQASLDAAGASSGAGTVIFPAPASFYNVTSPLKIPHNVTLRGQMRTKFIGAYTAVRPRVKKTTTTTVAIPQFNGSPAVNRDVIFYIDPVWSSTGSGGAPDGYYPQEIIIEGMAIEGSDATSTVGVYFEQGSGLTIRDSDIYGVRSAFHGRDVWLSSFVNVKGPARWIIENGGTSLKFERVSACGNPSGYDGFHITGISYSTFINTTCDGGHESAYTLTNCHGITFISPGTEQTAAPSDNEGAMFNFKGGNVATIMGAFSVADAEGASTTLISAANGDILTFVGGYFAQSGALADADLYVTSTARVTFKNSQFKDASNNAPTIVFGTPGNNPSVVAVEYDGAWRRYVDSGAPSPTLIQNPLPGGATSTAGAGSDALTIVAGSRINLGSARVLQGTGSPEGAITAVVGSLYLRTDGGATTTLYVKTSGTGNTGWTAK